MIRTENCKLTRLFNDFFNSEKSGGIILILCTLLSLWLANSPFQESYLAFWRFKIAGLSLEHVINDGLMAVFFLLIGLELERELYRGELSNLKNAALPLVAAFGGLIVPALVYSLFNWGTSAQAGAGIPMATDIAFAIGVLSLLGKRIPASLKVLLTALAVIDDLGAILVIALFYTKTLAFHYLLGALALFLLLLGLNRLKVYALWPYLLGGILMWYCMLHSGVHATITGVLLAFAMPFGECEDRSPSCLLQHGLHRPVAFFILPVFALVNTCIVISAGWMEGFYTTYAQGIMAGLLIGKPAGIFLFGSLAVMMGWCALPSEINLKHVLGVGFLGGIGFTMSMFITLLAFEDPVAVNQSKMAILGTSFLSGLLGYLWLRFVADRKPAKQDNFAGS